MLTKQQRSIILIAGATIYLALIASIAVQLYRSTARATVTVTTAPDSAKLAVDGNPVRGHKLQLELGQYDLVATKDGYQSASTDLTVNSTEDMQAGLHLTPEGDSETGSIEVRELIGAIEGQRSGALNRQTNPFVDILPYSSIEDLVSATYGTTDDNIRNFIEIKGLSTDGRYNTAQWLRSNDIDLATVEVRYSSNYLNPLVDRKRAERGF